MSGFDRLHAAVQHHIVNSLGWRSLRPLQDEAVGPVTEGSHALLLAPTAGGKTEAAIFPVLSRMLEEDWRGLSVVYVCPIKALLNNLEPRLSHYAGLVGRRVGLWHGDVGPAARRRIQAEPPDLLLTTPESLEAMLIFRKQERDALFGALRCLVVDELHAFAGDDRGWHLLAVAERLERVCGRRLQRLGLSATIGNPAALLDWLVCGDEGPRVVIAPPAGSAVEPEVQVDYVGSIANAAVVISRLHRGEKRLVFCDSRAGVEELANRLRGLGVTTHVSHSSLSVDARRQAEAAFQEGRDCVIVATSTLELGIDVGDLDRVIQIDAPHTVASFLQRLGRTGRRSGSLRNCLFLATKTSSLLQAAGLLRLWSSGYVEPVEPPEGPLHLFAQQVLALSLQEGAVGRRTWRDWLSRFVRAAGFSEEDLGRIFDHMLERGLLFEDGGLLSIGAAGGKRFGLKNFLELCSIFSSPPMFVVLHGRKEVGTVEESNLLVKDDRVPILSLAGRSWQVRDVNWRRRLAYVEPTDSGGASRWRGEGRALSLELCQAMLEVLSGETPPVSWTRRATEALEELRGEFFWAEPGSTVFMERGEDRRWWTFAGLRANRALALALAPLTDPSRANNLCVRLERGVSHEEFAERLEEADLVGVDLEVSENALRGLKFAECLPEVLALRLLGERSLDGEAAGQALRSRIRQLTF